MLMQENSRYAVGIDIGTSVIRCVVGHIDSTTGVPTVVGVGTAANSGMRKGVVANLAGPAKAIDEALGEAERMSGYEVNGATISINGSHIISTQTDGMIAVGNFDHEISDDDVYRVEEVATSGKVPANREILEVVPHSFRLDGQDNIKDPIGMTGTRLEMSANVVSALAPHVANLRKTSDMATVTPHDIIVSVLAGAKAVLTEQQLESGVAVIDLGAATTSVAVFEEGDLQYVGIVPVGGANITNDLAIGLKTDPSVAESVKLKHAVATGHKDAEGVSIKQDGDVLSFSTNEIDEIVEARLEEIFDGIHKELKKAGRAGKLPSGVVLTGAGSQMRGILEYTRSQLQLAARIGKPAGVGGVADKVEQPEFATAVGLMLVDSDGAGARRQHGGGKKPGTSASASGALKSAGGTVKKLLSKFRS